MRTEVPLIRPVHLGQAGEIADIHFELGEPNRNASADLLLGLRIARPDAKSGTTLGNSLVEAKLAATVQLYREEQDGELRQIPLVRNSWDLVDSLPVAASGEIPGVTYTGAEDSMLKAAGLIEPGMFYDTLMLALAERATPGRYRLKVVLSAAYPQFDDEDISLIVAYLSKGK